VRSAFSLARVGVMPSSFTVRPCSLDNGHFRETRRAPGKRGDAARWSAPLTTEADGLFCTWFADMFWPPIDAAVGRSVVSLDSVYQRATT